MSRCCWLVVVAWAVGGAGCAVPRAVAHDSPDGPAPHAPLGGFFANRHKDLDKAEQEELAKKLAEANGKGEAEGEGADKNGKDEFKPKHIRDNAFLVEESYNQEKGVVQHIFNWTNNWDRTPGVRNRNFLANYTMELPLGSQEHQFSFAIQYLTAFEQPDFGPAQQGGDIGDTFLNYRYQLFANDDTLWCAPRCSLILPTGDERFGFGNGQLGYQFNLPISLYRENFDFHFNAGYTFTPNVSIGLPGGGMSTEHDLNGYNLGGSVVWKPEMYLHFFVEALWLWNETIDDFSARNGVHQVLLNPGVRYAVTQNEGVEWVLGVSAPIGLTRDTPDIGVFAYMSIEYDFRNPDPKK
jgi:hypothetical protein